MSTKRKDYEVKYERINKKLETFMMLNKLNFSNIILKDIEKFILEEITTINRQAYYDSIRILNQILENNKVNVYINSKHYIDKCIKVDHYLDLNEIKVLCNILRNPCDKFICYGLFKGIYGHDYSDLLYIRNDMIAEDYSYIELPSDKTFKCDEYMQQILKDCLNENIYYKYVFSNGLRNNDYYEFSKSKYLIKPMPTNKNNNGYDPLSPRTLERKFKKFSDEFKDEIGKNINLNGTFLNKSGILYDMYYQEIKFGKEWTIEAIEEYFKNQGIKSNKSEIYRIYYNRYHNTNKNENRLNKQLNGLTKEIIKSVNMGELKEPLNVKSIINLCKMKCLNYSDSKVVRVLSNNEMNNRYFERIKVGEYVILPKYRDILFEEEVEKSKEDSSTNRNQRLSKGRKIKPGIYITTMARFKRNPDVIAEVLLRSEGKCEVCKNKAPFIRKSDSTPYLEVHHIISLSDGGYDTVENCIAVCPNCHRKFHFG